MNTHIDKFNRTFQEFINDLISVFPDDAEFQMVKMAIAGFQIAAPTALHDGFRERVVLSFGEKIMAKDEGFFLDADFSDLPVDDLEDATRIVNKVKQMYKKMKDDDRAVVWKYMRVLVLLSNKIASA